MTQLNWTSPTPESALAESRPTIGRTLRVARAELGLSLEALAERVRTSPAYLHRIEKGQAANPGRNFSIRLGIVLFKDDFDLINEFLILAGHLPLYMDR